MNEEKAESVPHGFTPVKEKKATKKQTTDALRTDRLAKKELRVREYKQRLNRLKKAERAQASLQKKISTLLNKKKKEQLMTQTEYKQMYGQVQSGTDYNLLHAPNFFTSTDNRVKANRDMGSILRAPNLILGNRKRR